MSKTFLKMSPFMFQEANLRIYLISGGGRYQVNTYNVTDQPYAILSDLDRNRNYEVIVNGTLGRGPLKKAMVTTPVPFSLDGRGTFLKRFVNIQKQCPSSTLWPLK